MKTIETRVNVETEMGKGLIVFICNQLNKLLSYGTAINSFVPNAQVSRLEVDRDEQFDAYVNNRLFVLIMWVRSVKQRKNTASGKQHLEFFLHDMEHHFVDPHAGKEVRDAFRWLKAYVKVYPHVSKKDKTQKAYEMIKTVYEALGIKFPLIEEIK